MENSIDKENFLDETPVQNTGEFSLDPDSPIYPFPQAKSTELISRKRPLANKDQNRDQLTLGGTVHRYSYCIQFSIQLKYSFIDCNLQ